MNPATPRYLHTLPDAPSAGVEVWLDKRKSQRVRYCAAIPVNSSPTGVPENAEFETVEARDLSQNGFSFYSATAPEEPWLLVQLGDEREIVYMWARVVRCEKDYDDRQRRFIVGCQFVRQLAASPD